jgi:TonB family protein
VTLSFILNHLWQSTLCVAAAAVLVRLLKDQPAKWRYRVWLAASLKFFVPFALLGAIGGQMPVRVFTPDAAPASSVSVVVEFFGQPFGSSAEVSAPSPESRGPRAEISASPESRGPRAGALAPIVLLSLWLGGCLALLVGKAVRWRQLRSMLLTAQSLTRGREADALERTLARLASGRDVEVCALASPVEPGVVGIRKPIILWPMALSARLNDGELDAIFTHELQHVQRRDNLAAALHGVLEIALWFHPAIWWIKTRLVAERERACDEAVLQLGSSADTYARGILKVCEFCLQTPAIAAAAVTGADLTRRMEDIMSDRKTSSLRLGHKLLLGLTALGVIIVPTVSGSLQASPLATPSTQQPGTWQAAVISAVAPFDVAVLEPAQGQTRVSGTVTSNRGGAVAGATVTATGEGNGPSVKVETDADGNYALDVPPGQYQISFQKPGFSQAKDLVFVTRGTPVTRNASLSVGAVSESIRVISGRAVSPATVEAAAALIERARQLVQAGSLADAETQLTSAAMTLRAVRSQQAAAARPPAPPLAVGTRIIRIGGDIKEPRKIVHADPVYPPVARAAGVSGIVIIDCVIGTDGKVNDMKVLRGQPLLNVAALDAVGQWEFSPTLLDDAPVAVAMTVTVNFQLQ